MVSTENNNLVILFVFGLFCLCEVFAQGVFEVKLSKFINEEGVDQLGRCCGNPDATQCLVPCRTSFRVCLTHYQTNFDSKKTLKECTYGRFTTPVLGANTIDLVQPRLFQFNFTSNRWPGYFTLVIDALGQVNRRSDSPFNLDKKDVLLSRLVKTGQLNPARDTAQSWITPAPYLHRNSSLRYSYRMVCYKNYYGSDCSTYCEPRNDLLGRYSCDNDGHIVCLPGWTNTGKDKYCTTAVCTSRCSGNGECVQPNTCKCSTGWTGSDCSQCLSLPGCQHGICTKPFECKCKPGWGGYFCKDDLNYCVRHHPCRNGGLCRNSGRGSYTCSCPAGYGGKNCLVELNSCSSSPCKNNGACLETESGYQCICKKPFVGNSCQIMTKACISNPCKNGGVCKNIGSNYTCQCLPEWFGRNCELSTTAPCLSHLCRNGGSCHVQFSQAVCLCATGYVGKHCEIPLITYKIVEEKENTKIVVMREKHALNTSQWIGICFGSGAGVLVLIAVAACLVHYKKKASYARSRIPRPQFIPPKSRDEVRISKVDSIVVIRDNSHRHSVLHADNADDAPAEISCWLSNELNDNLNHTSNDLYPSKKRSSVKSEILNGDQSLRHSAHQYQLESTVDCKTTVTNNSCNAPQHSTNCKPSVSHNSRLPTYEEVCKENDTLMHGSKSSC